METGIHTILLIYVCVYTCARMYYIRVGKGVTFSKINVFFFFKSDCFSRVTQESDSPQTNE